MEGSEHLFIRFITIVSMACKYAGRFAHGLNEHGKTQSELAVVWFTARGKEMLTKLHIWYERS